MILLQILMDGLSQLQRFVLQRKGYRCDQQCLCYVFAYYGSNCTFDIAIFVELKQTAKVKAIQGDSGSTGKEAGAMQCKVAGSAGLWQPQLLHSSASLYLRRMAAHERPGRQLLLWSCKQPVVLRSCQAAVHTVSGEA